MTKRLIHILQQSKNDHLELFPKWFTAGWKWLDISLHHGCLSGRPPHHLDDRRSPRIKKKAVQTRERLNQLSQRRLEAGIPIPHNLASRAQLKQTRRIMRQCRVNPPMNWYNQLYHHLPK